MKLRFKYSVGFTLIELLVALVLLTILVTSAAPMMQLTTKRNKEQELKKALWQIRDAIDHYKKAYDEGLIERSASSSGYPKTLYVLQNGVENIQDPQRRKIYFLRRIPRDPFADASIADPDETWGKRSYDSSFSEPQAGDDVYDVYSLSEDVGINKISYRDW